MHNKTFDFILFSKYIFFCSIFVIYDMLIQLCCFGNTNTTHNINYFELDSILFYSIIYLLPSYLLMSVIDILNYLDYTFDQIIDINNK